MTEIQKIEKVNQLISSMHVCMFTTKSRGGTLHSRPMAVHAAEFNGSLWFFTSRTSEKYDDLEFEATVNIAFCDLKENNFVSLTGEASFIEDRETMRRLWKPIMKTWFPEGPSDPNLALFKVECRQAEYWDSPSGLGMALALAKNFVTGDPSALGTNERVNL